MFSLTVLVFSIQIHVDYTELSLTVLVFSIQIHVDDTEFTAAYEGERSTRGQGSRGHMYIIPQRG